MITVWTTRLSFVVARMQNVEVRIVSENGGTANSRESCSASASNNEEPNLDDHKQSQMREKRVFVCPAHACWTCTQLDLQKQEADASSKQTNRKNRHHNKKRKKKKKKGGSTAFAAKSESKICVSNALLTVRRSNQLRQRWLIDLLHSILVPGR